MDIMKDLFSLENIKGLLNKQYKGKEVEIVLFNGINQYITINNFCASLNKCSYKNNSKNNNSISIQFIDKSKKDNNIIFYIMEKDIMYCQYELLNNSTNIYLNNNQVIQIQELA